MSVTAQPFIGSVSGGVSLPQDGPLDSSVLIGILFKEYHRKQHNQYSLFLKDKMAKVTFFKKILLHSVIFRELSCVAQCANQYMQEY